MKTQSISYKLVNFNIPTNLNQLFNEVLAYKQITRTSIMLRLIEDWVRLEGEYIKEDDVLREVLIKRNNTSKPSNKGGWIEDSLPPSPIFQSSNDDLDWEARFERLGKR